MNKIVKNFDKMKIDNKKQMEQIYKNIEQKNKEMKEWAKRVAKKSKKWY